MITRMTTIPYNLYRASQVQALDRVAIDKFRIPGATLMARAGAAGFDILRHRWPGAKRIAVLCGAGNNGGDGFVLARLAYEAGFQVTVYQVGDKKVIKGDALCAAQAMQERGLALSAFSSQPLDGFDVIVDALLGTGLDREVKGEWLAAIDAINHAESGVLSLDIPSGLQADTGQVLGSAVHADMTITFIAMKQGMLTGQGLECCGEILFNDLQVPAGVYEHEAPSAIRLNYESLKNCLKLRSRTAHKGHYGHVLIIGGDHGMLGAARMAGEATLRTGAGLVSVATRISHAALISVVRPELMAHGVENIAHLHALIEKATVIAIGPGLGRSSWAQTLLSTALEASRPMVIDADALNLLAENPARRNDWILTPHPGEAARLLETTASDIQSNRFQAVRNIQRSYGGVCVLKGAGTLIDDGTDPVGLCDAGNPGMASGGMGDVLTGVIAGLMAQGLTLIDAARLGVCIHALAGDRAAVAGERGIIASDLYPHIHRMVNPY